MSNLSAERETRWFRKSASEQYLFAKRLSPAERRQLEQALEQQIRDALGRRHTNAANAALTMWLSVQQARLRTHDFAHRAQHLDEQTAAIGLSVWGVTIPAVPFLWRSQRREYYSSQIRPEYQIAFDNFMRIIGDMELDPQIREAAALRLEYHWHSERTIAPRQVELLSAHGGALGLSASGYRMANDTSLPPLTATERAAVNRRGGLPAHAGVARQAGVQPQRAAATGRLVLPPRVLNDAMDMLTGFDEVGIDEVDMRDVTKEHTMKVIDHLQDLNEKRQAELDPRVWAAFVEADENPKHLITKLLALVTEDPPVLSARQH